MNLPSSSLDIQVDDAEQIINIFSAQIRNVLCFTVSLSRKYSLLGTQQGFCLVDNHKKSFKRFENKKNPFSRQADTGVSQGSVLEERSQVALVPSGHSKRFQKNSVYIFDYQLQTILYKNDFFLPIRQISLTDDSIVVANNRRIIIYNYSNDTQNKTQTYYLNLYTSTQPNKTIRYLEMGCEEKFMNNSLEDFDEGENFKECLCGKYEISCIKPYKILFSKMYSLNNSKVIQLSIYDWAIDKDYVLGSFAHNEPFSFAISGDGKLAAHSQNQGRVMMVRKTDTKQIYCCLRVSSSIKLCLSHGFFEEDDKLWYTVIRKDGANASMHFFRVQEGKKAGEEIKSKFRRYLGLYEKTIREYGMGEKMMGPEFYVNNGAVFAASMSGVVTEIIDLKISGSHEEKKVENFTKWREEQD